MAGNNEESRINVDNFDFACDGANDDTINMAGNNEESRINVDNFDFACDGANDDTPMLVNYLVTKLQQAMANPALQGEVQQLHAYGLLSTHQEERAPEESLGETSKRALSTVREGENPYQELRNLLLKDSHPSRRRGHAPHEEPPSKEKARSKSPDDSMEEDVALRRRRAQRSPTPTKRKRSPRSPPYHEFKSDENSKKKKERKRSPSSLSSSPSSSSDESGGYSSKESPRRGHRRSHTAWRRSNKLKKFKEEGKSISFLTYDGTFGATDKVLAFIQQFDVVFGDEGFTESSKLCPVAMHFQKSARQWWASLRANGVAPKTWKNLRASIMKQFLSSDAKNKVLTKWQSLKLTFYESIHKYVDKFWKLHLKATVYKKIDFEEQKQQFCAKLPKDMNEYVNSQRPKTISAVIHHTMVAARINSNKGLREIFIPWKLRKSMSPKGRIIHKILPKWSRSPVTSLTGTFSFVKGKWSSGKGEGFKRIHYGLMVKWTGERLANIARGTPLEDSERRAIGVAAGDLDGDGEEEIYVLNTDTFLGRKKLTDRLFSKSGGSWADMFSLPMNMDEANMCAGRSVCAVDRMGTGRYGLFVANYGGMMKVINCVIVSPMRVQYRVAKITVEEYYVIVSSLIVYAAILNSLLMDSRENCRGIAVVDIVGTESFGLACGNWQGPHRLFVPSGPEPIGGAKALGFSDANSAAGGFTDIASAEMARPSPIRTVIAADFDNDGFEELFFNNIGTSNRLFRQSSAGCWAEADIDIDSDGCLELLIAHGETQGAPARGASVRLTDESGRTQKRVIDAGSGYLCSMEPIAHFGLGQLCGPVNLRVIWPDGASSISNAPSSATPVCEHAVAIYNTITKQLSCQLSVAWGKCSK
ncbi:hypothetical protein L7F22_059800 [Adiantum nelumboides]|nr:hypothetical protein [Adiantum nelumboides]